MRNFPAVFSGEGNALGGDSYGAELDRAVMTRAGMLAALEAEVRRIEGAGRASAGGSPIRSAPISSGCPPLDRLLPGGGFARGVLVEWLGVAGGGAGVLAMLAAREAAREGGAVAVLDGGGSFYPPAAAALGVDLERVIVIRASSAKEELWALDQVLRCPGVAAAWASLERLDSRWFRRLQLGAESGGGLGLLLRPVGARGRPSWSDVQLLVEPRGGSGSWRWRVEVTRCRGAACGGRVELELDDETGVVREVSGGHGSRGLHRAAQLADPAAARRSARA